MKISRLSMIEKEEEDEEEGEAVPTASDLFDVRDLTR